MHARSALPVLLVLLATLSACKGAAQGSDLDLWIDSQRVPCTGVGPMSCYRVQYGAEIDAAAWSLFYDAIAGFDFVPGSFYQLRVRVADRPEPLPADVSSKTYELLEVLQVIADPAAQLGGTWRLLQVGDLRDPVRARSGEPLLFQFDTIEKTYAGDMSCNRVRGSIANVDAQHLELGPGMATLMACQDMTVERAISQALQGVRRYSVADGELTLLDGSGATLMVFSATSDD